jgi:hypothetical protein
MCWFTKEIETKTAVAELTPVEQYEENRNQLRVLDKTLAAAGQAIMEHGKDPRVLFIYGNGQLTMRTRLNAMTLDPTLQKLEANHAEILRKRTAALAEHARLKQLCGQAVY